MTDNPNKKIQVNLDHENKIIRIGCFFHEFKGVLICEATEEEKKKYYCEKFMTYPIIDDDWRVCEDKCIVNGIERLIIGKKGSMVPLVALRDALDNNAEEYCCDYSEVLVDAEMQGLTISNRVAYNSDEELPDTIVLSVAEVRNEGLKYRIESHWGNYYIPTRFCYIGEDDELYHVTGCSLNGFNYRKTKIVDQIANDVHALVWFFNKQNLNVLVTAQKQWNLGFKPDILGNMPKDWFYTLQTLEADINRKLEEMKKEYPGEYNHRKRPDINNSK